MAEIDDVAVGIDLGTTYSCVGVWQHNRVEIIANDLGNRTTPSCVAFTDTERFIGEAATNQAATNPVNTIFDVKRLIGRRFTDSTVQSDLKLWPFKVVSDPGEKPKVVVNYKGVEKPKAKCLKDAKMDKSRVDDVVLVGGSSRIPKVQQLLQEYFNGKVLCMSINPDEAVAYGAAVQAAVLNGTEKRHLRDLVLLDVTPLSLGVKLKGEVMSIVIPRNTRIPTSKKRIYTTSEDDQTELSFPVYEGERPRPTDNNLLGEITLGGLPPARRREVKAVVTFNIDANGVLHVTAECKIVGVKANTTINSDKGRLSKAKIETKIREAEMYMDEDKKFKRNVKAMNAFENYAYNMRSAISTKKMKAEKAINEAIEWVEANRNAEADEYESKKRELNAICDPFIASDPDIDVVEVD